MWKQHVVGRTNDGTTVTGLELIHDVFHPDEQRPFNFQFPLPPREVRRKPDGSPLHRLLNGIRERLFSLSAMERPIGMSRLERALRATAPILTHPVKPLR